MKKKTLCAICSKEIDLTRLHATDQKTGEPCHLSCTVNKAFKPEEGVPFQEEVMKTYEIISILRNPHNVPGEKIRQARIEAADILEEKEKKK